MVQRLQSTGRGAEDLRTTCYKATLVNNLGLDHTILIFEFGTITAALRPVDVDPAMELFAGKIPDLSFVRRPVGEVDLLIGVQNPGLFPVVADLERHRVGNIRLLSSDFGAGMLLVGVHPAFRPSALYQNQEAFKRFHAIFGSTTFKDIYEVPDAKLPDEVNEAPDAKDEIYETPDTKLPKEILKCPDANEEICKVPDAKEEICKVPDFKLPWRFSRVLMPSS